MSMSKFLMLIPVATLLVACSSTPIDSSADGSGSGSGAGTAGTTGSAGATGKSAGAQGQVGSSALQDLTNPRTLLGQRNIYFDFDSYHISKDNERIIEAHARFLLANPRSKVLLQGHADERGSREYNLALGQRRSDATRKVMRLFGVRENQMEAVSLGEEKPVCQAGNETCWAQNRRAHILHSAVGEF